MVIGSSISRFRDRITDPKLDRQLERNEFDQLIEMVLSKMYLEQRLESREAYGMCLPKLILARNLGILHHSSLIINIIEHYVMEPTSSLHGLEALDAFIKTCWPRVGRHRNRLLSLIFKAYYATLNKWSNYNMIKEDEFQQKCKDIFETLQLASPNILEPDLSKVCEVPTITGLLNKLGVIEFINDDIKIIRNEN